MTAATPDADLLAAFAATWPPAEIARHGGLETGRGFGGGGRLSSTHVVGDWQPEDIGAAEAQHHAWGQPPLVRLWDGDSLGLHLQAHGWHQVMPTVVLAIDLRNPADPPLRMTAIAVAWPPLAVQRDIWTKGGTGAARQAAMARVSGSKISLLGRAHDHPGGTAFVARHGPVAFLHSLHIVPELRRNGLGSALLRQAAVWAAADGATTLAVPVTLQNAGALALYGGLGFVEAGRYAYWQRD